MNHPPIPDDALDDRLSFVGTAGSGKTYNAMGRAERLLARRNRVVIPDPLGVWWGLRLAADGKTPSGFDVVIFGGPHGDLPLTEHAGALIGETVAGMKESCILDLSQLGTKAAERRFMLAFLTALYRNTAGEPLHVIFDEADMWAPQKLLDKEGEAAKLLGMMETLVRRGRVKGFIPWLITQRPAVISKDILSQVDGMVAFKLTGAHDRGAIGAWVEGQADRAEWKAIDGRLPTMERGQGVVWLPGRRILETVQFPPKATFDSSRTPKRGEKTAHADLKPLDLGALKDRLGKIEAEAKANDPAALKRRIRELEAEVARKPAPATPQFSLEDALRRGRSAGAEEQWKRDCVEFGKRMEDIARAFRAGVEAFNSAFNEAMRSASVPLRTFQRLDAPHTPRGGTPTPPAPQVTRSAPPPQRQSSGPPADGISRPQQRILDALAWLESVRIDRADRTRVAMLADQSPKSSGFEKNVSTLSTKGLIRYPAPGELQLTDAGRAVANMPEGKPTSADLQASICSKISRPQWVLLEQLIRLYPAPLTREDLAKAANVSAASSGFEKNVSTLSGFGFVEYPVRGSVAASPICFVE